MRVTRLWLTDFRSYESLDVAPAAGLTVVHGDNGEGKTNLLEAVGYLATLGSFRGAPNEALVRHGQARAVVRAEAERPGRNLLVEAEIVPSGRGRVSLNRQVVRRGGDLRAAFRATVFAPDDLALAKGGPGERRRYLDEALAALHPRHDATRADYERILRQRNALLRQLAGRPPTGETATTLEVWDQRLVEAGEALGAARIELVEALEPLVAKAYAQLAGEESGVILRYDAAWREGGLAAALAAARSDEVRRATSLVGPHRDDLVLSVGGLPARSQGSQGEQRTLALALRLAAHGLVTEATGDPPVLLLDDVFSELDAGRAAALVAHLPAGQALLTTAGTVPDSVHPDLTLRLIGGRLVEMP